MLLAEAEKYKDYIAIKKDIDCNQIELKINLRKKKLLYK